MAWAGLDQQAMSAIKDLFSTSEGTLEGRTLAAQAIREKGAVVSNDALLKQCMCSMRVLCVLIGLRHFDSEV